MRDGTGKLPTPDSHVDGENGAKTMVYNTKRNSKERKKRRKQEKRKKGRRNTTLKRKNSKLLITLLGHDRGCFSALLHV